MRPEPTKPPPALSAAELREALRLVLGELERLGAHPRDAHRWGRLLAHVEDLQNAKLARFALDLLRRMAADGLDVRHPVADEPPLLTRPQDWQKPGRW